MSKPREVRANYHETVGSLEVRWVCEGREARGCRNSINRIRGQSSEAFVNHGHAAVCRMVARGFCRQMACTASIYTVLSWYSCARDWQDELANMTPTCDLAKLAVQGRKARGWLGWGGATQERNMIRAFHV